MPLIVDEDALKRRAALTWLDQVTRQRITQMIGVSLRSVFRYFVLCAAPTAVIAQPNGALIRPSVDTFHVSRVVDGKATADTLIQSLASVRWKGQGALLQVYHQRDFSGGNVLDSLWMHALTLEPLRHSRRSSYLTADIHFTRGRITGRLVWPNGSSRIVDTLINGPFYDGGASDLIARALPLNPGQTANLLLYVPGFGPNRMRIGIAGRDTIRSRRGVPRAAWRLAGDIGGEPVTMWVATDNRDLLQIVAGEAAAPIKYVRH